MSEIVKSLYDRQDEILNSIEKLYCPEGFECDITYGNGMFWKNKKEPKYKFDLDPQNETIVESCSTNLPLKDNQLQNMVFDPPFLTYIRAGKKGNGNMVLAKRFSGYWRYDELEKHYKETLIESYRVLQHKGILVFKCQDIVHNHKLHCTHSSVIKWAEETGFRLKDLFVLKANHRLPSPNKKGIQKHARIFHSYFLVFEKIKSKKNKIELDSLMSEAKQVLHILRDCPQDNIIERKSFESRLENLLDEVYNLTAEKF